MNLTKKIAWLWIAFVISACQAFPLPVPHSNCHAHPIRRDRLPPILRYPPPRLCQRWNLSFELTQATRHCSLVIMIWHVNNIGRRSTTRPTMRIKAAALWGIGRTELADGRYQESLDALNNLVNNYP